MVVFTPEQISSYYSSPGRVLVGARVYMCVKKQLNYVILGSGNTCASENHFPQVKATVPVHLFDVGAPINIEGKINEIILSFGSRLVRSTVLCIFHGGKREYFPAEVKTF